MKVDDQSRFLGNVAPQQLPTLEQIVVKYRGYFTAIRVLFQRPKHNVLYLLENLPLDAWIVIPLLRREAYPLGDHLCDGYRMVPAPKH